MGNDTLEISSRLLFMRLPLPAAKMMAYFFIAFPSIIENADIS